VRSISHLGRTIPARLRTALEELQGECVIAGCHVDRHLEIDHNVPVAEGGPTALWNLNLVCHHHHDRKHAENLRIVGDGTRKRLVPAGRAPP
jgi:5-methylcytosine-specific restriction endonuclease McrA